MATPLRLGPAAASPIAMPRIDVILDRDAVLRALCWLQSPHPPSSADLNAKASSQMSLIGKKHAVVGLGPSCQAAHQLKTHGARISALLGDDLEHRRLPFDWVIGAPTKTAAWLGSGEEFPYEPSDLTKLLNQATAFAWNKFGIYFWHEFKNDNGTIDVN